MDTSMIGDQDAHWLRVRGGGIFHRLFADGERRGFEEVEEGRGVASLFNANRFAPHVLFDGGGGGGDGDGDGARDRRQREERWLGVGSKRARVGGEVRCALVLHREVLAVAELEGVARAIVVVGVFRVLIAVGPFPAATWTFAMSML